MKRNNKTASLHALCEAAIMVALAAVFSLLRFPPFRLDLWGNGGSVDFVMVPIIILGYRRGWQWAIPGGLALGIIECMIGGGMGYGLPSVLLDYVFAYGAVGVAGFFRDKRQGLVYGAIFGSIARFFLHFLSGITIWRLAMGDNISLFGMEFNGNTAMLYSLAYNGSYMLGNLIVALLVVLLLGPTIKKLPK